MKPERPSLEVDLGPYGTAGQLQQRPAPRGGGLFKEAWLERRMTSRELPTQRTRVRGWDLASSKGKEAAYTAGVLISKTRKGEFIVEDVRRDRLAPHEVEEFIVKTAHSDGYQTIQALPQDPGSAGKSLLAIPHQSPCWPRGEVFARVWVKVQPGRTVLIPGVPGQRCSGRRQVEPTVCGRIENVSLRQIRRSGGWLQQGVFRADHHGVGPPQGHGSGNVVRMQLSKGMADPRTRSVEPAIERSVTRPLIDVHR